MRNRALALLVGASVSCDASPGIETAAPPPAATAAPSVSAPAADPAPPVDSIAHALAHGRLVSLAPPSMAPAKRGVYEATIASPELGSPAFAHVALAMNSAPRAHLRALAYAELARALGTHVVPRTVERRLTLREMATLLADSPDELSMLQRDAMLQNDGAVSALVRALSIEETGSPWAPPSGREISVPSATEPLTWVSWAEADPPNLAEDKGIVRSYIEMLALDYLSGNVLRQRAWLDEDAHTLVLFDNATAFAARPDKDVQARVLRTLRAFPRFPRGLYDALVRFDREAAARVFEPGPFETWLLPPRTLVDLGERRAALVSLIEARVLARGDEAAVLCL